MSNVRINERHKITAEQINACADTLTADHMAILLASLTTSYENIAADFDLNVGTVKSRLNRARVALKAALAAKSA